VNSKKNKKEEKMPIKDNHRFLLTILGHCNEFPGIDETYTCLIETTSNRLAHWILTLFLHECDQPGHYSNADGSRANTNRILCGMKKNNVFYFQIDLVREHTDRFMKECQNRINEEKKSSNHIMVTKNMIQRNVCRYEMPFTTVKIKERKYTS
jgi:hypothetical protein